MGQTKGTIHSVSSPCERWSKTTKIAVLTWERRGFDPHISLAFIASHGRPNFKELWRNLKSRPRLRWRFDCDGCCFLIPYECRYDVPKRAAFCCGGVQAIRST